MSDEILHLLERFRSGQVEAEEVVQRLVRQPFEEHLIGRFDHLREERTGIPEAILAEGKSPEAIREILATYLREERFLMATRMGERELAGLQELLPRLQHFEEARIVATKAPLIDRRRPEVLVISAGTLDRPVAEEATVTSRLFGNPTRLLLDVGVAGIGRIAAELGSLDKAGILIVVAGMDGVLASLVGGLARQPVIAVPTSVGYGASFGGLAPLLTMLNSCAPGTAVMNIDNGFGAATLATKINLLATSHPSGEKE